MTRLSEAFGNPSAWYRSFPFWGWNSRMEKTEIRRQIEGMKMAGAGGFFIHSRDGLETEYMGDEWNEAVRYAVETAKELGMYAWLYDEDRFPSGTAGGAVTAAGEAYCCKGLTMEVVAAEETWADGWKLVGAEETRGAGWELAVAEETRSADWELAVADEYEKVKAVYRARVDGMEIEWFERLWVRGRNLGDNSGEESASERPLSEAAETEGKVTGGNAAGGKAAGGKAAGGNAAGGKAAESWHLEQGNLESWEVPPLSAGEVYLIVRLEVSGPSAWFNNEAPPDNLNPETVKLFIDKTHEVYRQIAGDEFGGTVPGIFTDEPSLADRHCAFHPRRGWIPWSIGMEEYFQCHRGYDIYDLLPYYYFNGIESRKIRHDYWYVITERFTESFSKTLGEWCGNHGLSFTGHFLQEDKLGLCTRVNGAVMPHYRYQQVPGIDMLCEQTREYMTVKQCTSVANQLGKPVVLSETYACTGWDFSLEAQKWIGDWQYVLGVNRRCPHMALYSLEGCRKRDYPPSFNYQTPWWNKNSIMEDYFARLGLMLQEGRPVRDLLVLHPATTAWSQVGTNPYGNPIRRNERDVPEVDQHGYRFNELIEYLCRNHLDCDLGDEILMRDYACVSGKQIVIEQAAYAALVLPPVDTVLTSTADLLAEFLEAGGSVFVMGDGPYMIEGRESERIKEILAHCHVVNVEDKSELVLALEQNECRLQRPHIFNESGMEEENVLYQLRRTQTGWILFLVNNNREKDCLVDVVLKFGDYAERWNPMDGSRTRCPVRKRVDGLRFAEQIERSDSRLYYIYEAENHVLADTAEISLSDTNNLVLDMCSYHFEGEPWSEIMEVWQMQRDVRERLGMRQIYENGLEQRYRWIFKPHENDNTLLSFRFVFEVREVPRVPVYLMMEHPENFRIYLNGEEQEKPECLWYIDRAFRTVLLKCLQSGKNELLLQCDYRNSMELENCWILGSFGVSSKREMIDIPSRLNIGSWTEQGLFHYAGNVEYHYEILYQQGSIMLNIPGYEGTWIEVRVNGYARTMLEKQQCGVELTEYLHEGKNDIRIIVGGSLRNMMGPFHYKDKRPEVTNDGCFHPEGQDYTMEYQVVECGLLRRPYLSIIENNLV